MHRALTVVVASVLLVAAQTRTQPPSSARERAYRENNVGVARLEQYEYAGAAAAFRRALEIDPSLPVAHLNLAIALLYDARLDDAEREAQIAVQRLPVAPQPWYVRGLVARAAGRDGDAAAAFRRVLEIDPADAASRIQLGQTLTAGRRYPEAIALLEEALKAEPFNATAAYGLAIALARAGRAAEGRDAMARFQQLRDNPASVTYSTTYLGQGRYAEAVASTGLEPELVDQAIPSVTFVDATSALLGGLPAPTASVRSIGLGDAIDVADGAPTALARVAASLSRSVTLADLNGDGALDLLFTSGKFVVVRLNQAGRLVGAAADIRVDGTVPIAAVSGDYDNDGRADLFVVGYPAHRLYHQEADGAFRDVTQAAGIPAATGLARAAAFADVDHDGDLDIVVAGLARPQSSAAPAAVRTFPDAFAPAATQLLRNAGNGRFADATGEAHLANAAHIVSIVPTDFDNRRDIDLLFVGYGGRPALFSNLRDGTFRDVAAEAGLPPQGRYTSAAAGDLNKDGATDFFFGRLGAPGLIAMSDGSNRFVLSDGPEETRNATAAQFIDYDNDGLLDLLLLTDRGPRLLRSVGRSWVNVTSRALPGALHDPADPAVSLAVGDIDGDGDEDVIVRLASGRVRAWRNDGGNARASLRIQLTARVSNRSAVGSKVELRAGSLRHNIETSSATPAVGPSDVLFGLGSRGRADVVRVLWPAGILQAEVDLPAPTGTPPTAAMAIAELNRKPSSCPYLFTWNGSRFEFITDFMGGGEMGSWIGPGARAVPDPDEVVRIGRDRLRPRDGRYEIRVTNELEEAVFLDRLQLVAVAHPADVEVYPNEGLRSPAARRPTSFYTVHAAHAPMRAVDDHGHDVLDRIARVDRRYVDDFELEAIRGYAKPHSVTLTIDTANAARVLLLLTGWTDYAFSSDNLAAHQAALPSQPPSLQIRAERGVWRTVIPELGLPVGRPQTIAVDIGSVLERRPAERYVASAFSRTSSRYVDVRITTSLRVYWDQILVDTSEPAEMEVARLDPREATLRWRGFSAETTPDGREPFGYDYDRVSPTAPWKTMPGRYTRFGDVTPLLTASDDRFVIAAPGDEIAVAFDDTLPPIPPGWTRTFLLYADGFSKEMNLHSSSPDRLEPLPFHAMTRYPYSPPERYPDTRAHRRYREEYNTRLVAGPLPPLLLSNAGLSAPRPRP